MTICYRKSAYILLHDWEGNTGEYSAGSIGPSAVRDNTEAEN